MVAILFDFITPEMLNVSEIYILSNYGETTLVGEEFVKPIISFPLPDGAGSIEFDDGLLGERFIKTEDGFGDTQAYLLERVFTKLRTITRCPTRDINWILHR